MNDDAELLRRYANDGAEDAFAELVRRHVNLVYSAALRQLNGDAHLAADATQLVFTDLARKADAVARHRILAGWLFTSTRFATAKLVRTERRRQAREQEAHLMHELFQNDRTANVEWQRVRPVIDEALGELNEADREAILLRFFEGRDFASVGAKLNLTDNTARMRVERALEKLRSVLQRRGVTSTTAALATVLGNQAVLAAPAGLAATVTGAALGSVSAAAVASSFMAITKLQLGLAGAIAAAGTTGFVVQANTAAQLRAEMSDLRQQSTSFATLATENARLARTAAEIAELRRDDVQLAELRDEAAQLTSQMKAAALKNARPLASTTAPMGRQAQVQLSGPVFDISKVDQTPKAKFQARPEYPAALRTAGTPGEVVVDFIVDDKGDVQNAFALRSSQREFESSAVEAVSKWKFAPGQKSGAAVNTHLQVPIVFKVNPESRAGVLSWETKPGDVSAPWF